MGSITLVTPLLATHLVFWDLPMIPIPVQPSRLALNRDSRTSIGCPCVTGATSSLPGVIGSLCSHSGECSPSLALMFRLSRVQIFRLSKHAGCFKIRMGHTPWLATALIQHRPNRVQLGSKCFIAMSVLCIVISILTFCPTIDPWQPRTGPLASASGRSLGSFTLSQHS